jgi:hypothetical protein
MKDEGGEPSKRKPKDISMLTAIIITLIIAAALGYSLRAGRDGETIVHRPYNNRYNDASGAREETFG